MNAPNLLSEAQLALQAAPANKPLPRTQDAARAYQAAEEFEAIFLAQMLGHMFTGIGTDGLFGGGHGEDMFRPMLIDEFGKVLARAGGIGIADAVQREILKAQEVR